MPRLPKSRRQNRYSNAYQTMHFSRALLEHLSVVVSGLLTESYRPVVKLDGKMVAGVGHASAKWNGELHSQL